MHVQLLWFTKSYKSNSHLFYWEKNVLEEMDMKKLGKKNIQKS